MQAVILAAGKSSRFYPLSNNYHKCMIKLLGKPILEHTIEKLKKEGIKDIVLVTDLKDTVFSYFGDGKKLGVSITYVKQSEALGAGNALLLARNYIKDDFLLLYPHHVDIDKFITKLISGREHKNSAAILIEEREETWKYGVVEISNSKLKDLVEKPKQGKEPSRFCIVGLYLFPKRFLQVLSDTPQEHYQLEKAILNFIKTDDVFTVLAKDQTVTLKYPWDLLSFKNYLLKSIKKSINKNVKIAKSAEIIGEVIVEDGVKIMEGARIKGPCYIGKNSFIGDNVVLRDGVDIEENCVIGAGMEMKNTIIMANSKTHSGFVGDSIVGESSRIGTQFCTANVRLDREKVKTILKGEKIETGLKFLGMITGKNARIGIKCSTMPGVIIGENSIVGPSTTVMKNIEDNTKYFTKFEEVIEKR